MQGGAVKVGFLKKNSAKDRTRPADGKWEERYFVLTAGPRPGASPPPTAHRRLFVGWAGLCVVCSSLYLAAPGRVVAFRIHT